MQPTGDAAPLRPIGFTAPPSPPRRGGMVVALAVLGVCGFVVLACLLALLSSAVSEGGISTGAVAGLTGAMFVGAYAGVAALGLRRPPEPGPWWSRVHVVEAAHDELVGRAHQWQADREPWALEALAPLRDAASALAAEAQLLDEAAWQKRPVDARLFDLHADAAVTAASELRQEFGRVLGHFAATDALPSPPGPASLDALTELADSVVARFDAECVLAGQPTAALVPAPLRRAPDDAVRALDALSLLGDETYHRRASEVVRSAEAAIGEAMAYREALTAMSSAFPAEAGTDAQSTFAGSVDDRLRDAAATEAALVSQLARLAAAAAAAGELAAQNGTLSAAASRSALQRLRQTTELLRSAADHGDDVAHRLGPGDGVD